jgi:uncharacterized Zn finger protein (UPF0148 family)
MKNSYEKTIKLTCTCGAVLQEDDETNKISCPSCGKTFKNIKEVYDLPHIKKLIEREQEKLVNQVKNDISKSILDAFNS